MHLKNGYPVNNVLLVDNLGLPYGVKQIDGKPRFSSMPYLYDIAEGNVSGHVPWSKIGFNGDIGVVEEDLWTVGGSFVPPTSAQQMEVVSGSSQDDILMPTAATTGTGIYSVIIYYLDSSGAEKTETVNVNGTAIALTASTDIHFVNGFRAVTTGSGLKAAGNIDLRAVGGTPIFSRIASGYTRARNINYKIPAGKSLYVTSFTVSVYGATKGVRFTTRANYDFTAGVMRSFFLPYTEIAMTNGAFNKPLEIPTAFPAGTHLKVSGVADAAGAVCAVSLRGWQE